MPARDHTHRIFKFLKACGWDVVKTVKTLKVTRPQLKKVAARYEIARELLDHFLSLSLPLDKIVEIDECIKSNTPINIFGSRGCGKTFLVHWIIKLYRLEALVISVEAKDAKKQVGQFHLTGSIVKKRKLLVFDDIVKDEKWITEIVKCAKVGVLLSTTTKMKLENLKTVGIPDDPERRVEILADILGVDRDEASEIAVNAGSVAEAVLVSGGGDYQSMSEHIPSWTMTQHILANPDRNEVLSLLLQTKLSLGTILKFVAANLPTFFKRNSDDRAYNYLILSSLDTLKYSVKKEYIYASLAYTLRVASGNRYVVNPYREFEEKKVDGSTEEPEEPSPEKRTIQRPKPALKRKSRGVNIAGLLGGKTK